MTKTQAPAVDGKMLGTRTILLDDIIPHPLNPNRMDPGFLEKLKVHIKRTGRYPHLIVREHPEIEGKYQLLDGEHRRIALREIGEISARCDVWDVSDREAQIYLATLNRLQGQDIPVRRAELVHELLKELDMGDLAGLLPETEEQLDQLHNLLEFPAGDIAEQLAAQDEEVERLAPNVIQFVVTQEQQDVIEQAIELASDGTPGRDRRARGLLNLARTWLGSNPEAVTTGIQVDAATEP